MNHVVTTLSILISFVSLVGAIWSYHYNELKSLERNVESAIVKGIDPIAVRCAYASERDVVCVAYASSGNNINAPIISSKK